VCVYYPSGQSNRNVKFLDNVICFCQEVTNYFLHFFPFVYSFSIEFGFGGKDGERMKMNNVFLDFIYVFSSH
jgi:hypothetical protein